MQYFDYLGDACLYIGWHLQDWIDKIDSSWIEMPKIKTFLQRTKNTVYNARVDFYNLTVQWDNLFGEIKQDILGVYSSIDTWFDSKRQRIEQWFEDRFVGIEHDIRVIDRWLDDADNWVEAKISEGIDNSKEKIEGIVSDRFERILDRVFE